MTHPDRAKIRKDGKGPAVVEFLDGERVATGNLAYTTSIKFVDLDGLGHTVKAPAVKRIVWFRNVAQAEAFAEMEGEN